MRALTAEELELVAGGLGTTTSGTTITVTGNPTTTWWPTFTYTTTTGGGGGGGGGGSGGSSNEDLSVNNDDAPCENGAAIKAAAAISNFVNTQGNYEYVGVLVRNADGTFGLSQNELYTNHSETYSAFDNNGDFASSYGIVHNHPFNDSDYNSNFLQRYPSAADWDALDTLVAGGADPNHLSIFILDPFGDMREFQYSDRALFENMSDSQRNQGNNLPAETQGCG